MKLFLIIVIFASAGVMGYLGYKIVKEKRAEVAEEKAAAALPPPPDPETVAADLNLRIRVLRQDLYMELKMFETTREFQVNGFGAGPKSTAYRYTEAEPETPYWIANTREPKLRRARELQREIEQLKGKLMNVRAQM